MRTSKLQQASHRSNGNGVEQYSIFDNGHLALMSMFITESSNDVRNKIQGTKPKFRFEISGITSPIENTGYMLP